ncbi:MAG: hypothetical protein H6660_09150 [Ardenticatenaceae bacterium]|nr:hypothetical protein [Ardenticatenaceae bacterium]
MNKLQIMATYDAPGRGPVGLTWDGRFLWNSDYVTGTLYQIDTANMQVVKTFLCPGNLSGITWDGTHLWQSLHDADYLRSINPLSNDFDDTIALVDQGWLSGLAWDGQQLWAVSQQQGKLLAINPETHQVERTLSIPVAGGGLEYYDGALWVGVPLTMAFDPVNQGFDWTSDTPQFAILQLDPQNGRELGRYAIDFLPMGLAWANGELWLSHTGGRKLHCARL